MIEAWRDGSLARGLGARAADLEGRWGGYLSRVRYQRFHFEAARAARLRSAELTLRVASSAQLGRVVWRFQPGTSSTVVIEDGVQLYDGVILVLSGGTIHLGADEQVRNGAILSSSGNLTIAGRGVISYGAMIHCSEEVTLGPLACMAERSTIVDSTHFFTDPDSSFWHNVRSSPTSLGRNSWVCPGAVVTRGVRVGDFAIVGSDSVAIKDVPDGHLVSGVPAQFVRELRRPWLEDAG